MRPVLLLALLLAAACKHSSSASSETHSETQTTTESSSSETGTQTTTTVVTEAPGKTTTTVEDYGPPEEVMPSESEPGSVRAVPDGGVPATLGVVNRPSHGPLVRRTVTVTELGQETTQTTQQAVTQAQAATEVKAQSKADVQARETESSTPALSCAFGGWLAIVGVVAAVFGLAFFALKRRGIV